MKFIIKLILNAIAVVITASLLSGVHLHGYGYAIVLAAVLALLNASLKPLLILLTIPATIFSLGLFLLVINAIIVLTAEWIIPQGFQVDGFWWALLFSIILSFINSLLERLTVKRERNPDDDPVKIYDKDGNRMV